MSLFRKQKIQIVDKDTSEKLQKDMSVFNKEYLKETTPYPVTGKLTPHKTNPNILMDKRKGIAYYLVVVDGRNFGTGLFNVYLQQLNQR